MTNITPAGQNTAANNALPKCGQDVGTSAAAILQVWFWGWTAFLFNLIGKFNFTFSIKHFHPADVFQRSALRQCRPLAASVVENESCLSFLFSITVA
jgi:hypothetical protein